MVFLSSDCEVMEFSSPFREVSGPWVSIGLVMLLLETLAIRLWNSMNGRLSSNPGHHGSLSKIHMEGGIEVEKRGKRVKTVLVFGGQKAVTSSQIAGRAAPRCLWA